MGRLRGEVHTYDEYEASAVVPFIEASMDRSRLQDVAGAARKAKKRHITHPHPYKSPPEGLGVARKASAAFEDWLEDLGQHPDAAAEGRGEQGP
jgi:hypothetical protein